MKRESTIKFLNICVAGCSVVAILFLFFYAGSSDYWTMVEPRATVPGSLDKKYAFATFIFGFIAIACYMVKRVIENYSYFDDLAASQVFCDSSIATEVEHNRLFEMQVCDFLQMFKNGVYGDLSANSKAINKKSMRRGKGQLIGEYHSTRGNIRIITNMDRTKIKVTFSDTIYKAA